MAIGRYRGFGGAHIQRFRAGQRINIPRSFGRQRMPIVRNTTIFLGGWQGGQHCCCGGGGSRFLNWMTGITAFMGFFGGLFGNFFGGGAQQVDPAAAAQQYSQGQAAGLNTPGDYNSGYGAGQSTPAATTDAQQSQINALQATIEKLQASIESLTKQLNAKKDGDDTEEVDEGRGGGSTEQNVFESYGTDKQTDYSNRYDCTTGFSYNNQLSYKAFNVGQTTTYSAFLLNNNKDSSITISKSNNTVQKWGEGFERMQKTTDTDKENMTEEEFMNWFTDYANNAQEDAKAKTKTKTSGRKLTDTVDMDDFDKKYLTQLFKVIAGDDNTLSKTEWTDFMTSLFSSNHVTEKDGKLTLTRAGLNSYIKEYIQTNKKST